MADWKPSTTVAAVVEQGGRLLMIEEHTADGLRLNQPAGHLDPGETLVQAAVRETLEETGWTVAPQAVLGTYMARYANASRGIDVTYLRHTFVCSPVSHDPCRALDTGIVRALWLTPDEILATPERHRSPLVSRAVLDWLAGRRYPLELVWTHDSALTAPDGAP